MHDGAFHNVLINGGFQRGLWNRSGGAAVNVECAVWRQTFAADRWKIRYARPDGAPVCQAKSADVPGDFHSDCSLEIRGAEGVGGDVFLGQRIEAAEASRYRRRLNFSAWFLLETPDPEGCPVQFALGTAKEPDVFGNAFNDNVKPEAVESPGRIPANQWTRLELGVDARQFSANGLSVELQFPAAALGRTGARIRVAGAQLADATHTGLAMESPAGMEMALAKRFFQRHDATTINTLGRALAVNAHEMFFQFSFPEMRASPECTLPRDDAHLRVFCFAGIPQEGFQYDITDRSRGSVIIRAIKPNHGLRDGFLRFTGPDAAILLDAEL